MDFGILGYTIFSLLSERNYSPMSQKILQVVMIAADFTSIAPIQWLVSLGTIIRQYP